MNNETIEDMRLRLDIRDDEYLIRRYESEKIGEAERTVILELLEDRGVSLDREENAKRRASEHARMREIENEEEKSKGKFRWIGGALGFAIGFIMTRQLDSSGRLDFAIGGLCGMAGAFFFGDILYWILGGKPKR